MEIREVSKIQVERATGKTQKQRDIKVNWTKDVKTIKFNRVIIHASKTNMEDTLLRRERDRRGDRWNKIRRSG